MPDVRVKKPGGEWISLVGPQGPQGPPGVTGWSTVSKSTDQAVVNSAVLQDDSALSFLMLANSKYRIRGKIFFDTTAAGDFKYTVSGPASPTLVRAEIIATVPGAVPAHTALQVAYPAAAGVSLVGTGTTGGWISIDMIVHNGSTAGTFRFRFSQNTAQNDSGAVVRAGSYLEWSIV